MGYLKRPAYYRRFQCTASRCTDSCCVGWEIDIDDETLEKYRKVKGDFGKRLWSRIEVPDEEEGEPAHFRLTEGGRCPFLNEQNLCEIYINLGEDCLGYICTHHPRFYEWYVGGKEAGLGLVCEAAAELILQSSGFPEFEIIEEEDLPEDDIMDDEDLQAERRMEEQLFTMRDQLFRVIKPEQSFRNFDSLTDALWLAAERMQEEYDESVFSEMEDPAAEYDAELLLMDEESVLTERDIREPWSGKFWTEENLTQLIGFYEKLEINDPQWLELLGRMKAGLPELLSNRSAFLQAYAEHVYEYEQLLIYFIYRYFMKVRCDNELCGKVAFALISTCMIQLADIYFWLREGELVHKMQIDICKLYAKEIEYDEGNVEEISQYQI